MILYTMNRLIIAILGTMLVPVEEVVRLIAAVLGTILVPVKEVVNIIQIIFKIMLILEEVVILPNKELCKSVVFLV